MTNTINGKRINQIIIFLKSLKIRSKRFYEIIETQNISVIQGMRLKEGINIFKLFRELNWGEKEREINLRKLLKKWERFLESGLLIRTGDRYFLRDPEGMELSNQVLISMFNWWDEIN